MTQSGRYPGWTREEVEAMAKLLSTLDADSRHALNGYLKGNVQWDYIIPVVRRRVAVLINSREKPISRDVRLKLLEFAATHGIKAAKPGFETKSDEPLTELVQFRTTALQAAEIRGAAKRAKMKPNDWARQVLLKAAREDLTGEQPT